MNNVKKLLFERRAAVKEVLGDCLIDVWPTGSKLDLIINGQMEMPINDFNIIDTFYYARFYVLDDKLGLFSCMWYEVKEDTILLSDTHIQFEILLDLVKPEIRLKLLFNLDLFV